MAILTLSTLASSYFKGLRNVSSAGSAGLAAVLNTIIAKVNEVIDGSETLDTLAVGTLTNYYLSGHSWMLIDGAHPPMFSKIWLQGQDDGHFYELSVTGGALAALTDQGAP